MKVSVFNHFDLLSIDGRKLFDYEAASELFVKILFILFLKVKKLGGVTVLRRPNFSGLVVVHFRGIFEFLLIFCASIVGVRFALFHQNLVFKVGRLASFE